MRELLHAVIVFVAWVVAISRFIAVWRQRGWFRDKRVYTSWGFIVFFALSVTFNLETFSFPFDAYGYAETLALYPDDLRRFLDRGGMPAWGLIPNTGEEAETITLGKVGEAQQQILQLLAIQVGEDVIEGRGFFDQVGLAQAGPQRGDDMLVPAAPVVGTVTDRAGDAAFVGGLSESEGDPYTVRLVLAALDLRLQYVAALHQGDHRASLVVVLAPAERLGGGLSTDGSFVEGWDGH